MNIMKAPKSLLFPGPKILSIHFLLFLTLFLLINTGGVSPAQSRENYQRVRMKDGRTYEGTIQQKDHRLLIQRKEQKVYVSRARVEEIEKLNGKDPLTLKILSRPINKLSSERPVLGTVSSGATETSSSPLNDSGRFVRELEDPELGEITVRYAITKLTPDTYVAEGINYAHTIEFPTSRLQAKKIIRLFSDRLEKQKPESYLEMASFLRRAGFPERARSYLKKYSNSAKPSTRDNRFQQEKNQLFASEAKTLWKRARMALRRHQYLKAREHFRELNISNLPKQLQKQASDAEKALTDGLKSRSIVVGLLKRFVKALDKKVERVRWNHWLTSLVPERAERLQKALGNINLPDPVTEANVAKEWLKRFRFLSLYGNLIDPNQVKKKGNKLVEMNKNIRDYFTEKNDIKAKHLLKKIVKWGHDRDRDLLSAMARHAWDRKQRDTGVFRFSLRVQGFTFPYFARIPDAYRDGVKWPVVVLLHDRGNKAQNMIEQFRPELLESWGYVTVATNYSRTPEKYHYTHAEHRSVLDMLKQLSRNYHIDHNRIYLVGLGMGARAAWDIGLSHPDHFAGIVPIAGTAAGSLQAYAHNATGLPIYTVAGANSQPVSSRNRKLANRLQEEGRDVTYIEYTDRGEGSSYNDRYPEVVEWLAGRSRNSAPETVTRVIARHEDRSAYWLEAVPNTQRLPGSILVNKQAGELPSVTVKSRGENVLELEGKGIKRLTFFWDRSLIHPDRNVTILSGEKTLFNGTPELSLEYMLIRARETSDREMLHWGEKKLR